MFLWDFPKTLAPLSFALKRKNLRKRNREFRQMTLFFFRIKPKHFVFFFKFNLLAGAVVVWSPLSSAPWIFNHSWRNQKPQIWLKNLGTKCEGWSKSGAYYLIEHDRNAIWAEPKGNNLEFKFTPLFVFKVFNFVIENHPSICSTCKIHCRYRRSIIFTSVNNKSRMLEHRYEVNY